MEGFILEGIAKHEKTDRTKSIGSSDIPTILGLNPYGTPLETWAEKTGKVAPKAENAAMKYGKRVEPIIQELWQDLNADCHLYPNDTVFQHKDYEWATATPDSFIAPDEGEIGILECKHTAVAKDWDAGGIPDYAHIQVQWQMGICGINWSRIAAVVGGRAGDLKDVRVNFDELIWNMALEAAIKFWDCVQKDIPPMAGVGDLQLLRQVMELREEQVALADEQWAKDYEAAKVAHKEAQDAAKVAEDRKKELEAQIAQELGGCNVGVFSGGQIITIKEVIRKPYTTKESRYWTFNYKGNK